MCTRTTFIVLLHMTVCYAAEPAKITGDQVKVFQTGAEQTGKLRADAPRMVACQGGALQAGPDLLKQARSIVVDTETSFTATMPSKVVTTAASRLFRGLLTANDEVRMSLADVTVGNCADVRTASIQNVIDQQRSFMLVASLGAVTFDLRVNSDPTGATITYRRAGDKNYQPYNSITDTTIQNLDWAIWFIKLDANGYASAERTFNPYVDRILSLHVRLEKSNPK
jgi:hypothetical protein